MRPRRTGSGAAWALGLALAASSCEAVAPTASAGGPGPSSPQAQAGGGQEAAVEADTLYAASVSGVTEATTEVIRTDDDWASAWARVTSPIAPAPEAPVVDFATRQVVLLALGSRPSGGYGLEVKSVERAEGTLRISVTEVAPGPGCFTTQALTQPVLLLGLPAGPESVEVTREESIRDCV